MGNFDDAVRASTERTRMELLLTRQPTTDAVTLGRLFVDGDFECDTLERPEAGTGPLAIAPGRYKVIITRSVRFNRMLPLVTGVLGRTGIRIHPGNTAHDTEGCILLGTGVGPARVADSRVACERFQHKLARVLATPGGEAFLTIRDPRAPAPRVTSA